MGTQRPRISRRSFLAGASAAAAVSVPAGRATLASSSSRRQQAAAAQEQPVKGGTLTYGYAKPAENIINPLNTVGTGQNTLIEPMFLRLVYGRKWTDGLNPPDSGDIELAVAETMKEIEKDRVWEFTLRKNVFWHDGKPVTADDVILGAWLANNKNVGGSNETPTVSLKGAEKLKANGAPVGDVKIDGITKLSDNAVRIELDKPIANYWKSWYVGYWPMPFHIFGNMPFDKLFADPYATMPVGNGPFKASKFVDGQYMEMVANDQFYLGRPLLDKLIVRFGDSDTLSAAVQAQEIDGTTVSPGPVYDKIAKLDYIAGNPVPSTHPNGLVVNYARLGDQATGLTKAIMHAIDVDTINKQLFSGTLRPSNYLFEQVPGYEKPPDGFETYSYDPGKARAALQDIKWDSGKELQWLIIGKSSTANDAMQAMLAQVGIKAKYNVVDAATAIDNLYRKPNFDIVFSNFGPYEFFEYDWKYFKCGWTYDTGGFNYAGYCNKTVDDLFTKGLAETDAAKAKASFDPAILELNKVPPQATLYRGATVYVWNKRVQGAYPYQYRIPDRPPFERVWIKPS